jgi:transportin-1
MAWQPSPESLSQLAAFLKDSLSGFDKNAQKQAELVRAPAVHRSRLFQTCFMD